MADARPVEVTPKHVGLITAEMRERLGKWFQDGVSPAITATDIRRWAIAVYWPETPPPLFWDEGCAKATRWGGIVAPEDFNPFAWPVGGPAREQDAGTGGGGFALDRHGIPLPTRGRTPPPGVPAVGGMNAGRRDEFGERMRPGDTISSRTRLADWAVSQTRFGPTLFASLEIEWRNQAGALVRLRLQSVMRYLAPSGGGR